MARAASWDLKRQITYTETIKKNATEKYVAKIHDYDNKICELKVKLADALIAEQADTVSAT